MVKSFHLTLEDFQKEHIDSIYGLTVGCNNRTDFLLLCVTCLTEKLLSEGKIRFDVEKDCYVRCEQDEV